MGFDAQGYFNSLNMYGIRLGLDAVRELFAKAGNPEKELRFLHIAGTNGKGSTGAMLECALRSAGLRTGFYTSPHLIDIRERFRVNGLAVSPGLLEKETEELKRIAGEGNYSYFEFATVLAARIFLHAKVDAVLWETGMGGRLDATNAVLPEGVIITNIALDHESRLGHTLAEIAGEKAGILKPGKALFHGVLPPEAKAVILQKAAELSCPVTGPGEEVPELLETKLVNGVPCQCFAWGGRRIELALPGKLQRENFRIAGNVLTHFAPLWGFDLDRAFRGLAKVRWPGRFQRLSDRLWVDGGHNPDGVRAFCEALRESFPGEKFTVVYGAFRDKHVEKCLPLLAELAKEFRFVPLREEGREHCSREDFAALAAPAGVPFRWENGGAEAVRHALAECSGKVIVSGSLHLAGEVLEAMGETQKVLDLI